jgi:hypothetical protein
MCTPPIIARQWLGKVPVAMNTCNNRTAGRMRLRIPLSLLGNNAEEMFPQQQRIVGGVVFYAGDAVSKESRLVLPRTSCCHIVSHEVNFMYCSNVDSLIESFVQ